MFIAILAATVYLAARLTTNNLASLSRLGSKKIPKFLLSRFPAEAPTTWKRKRGYYSRKKPYTLH